MPFTLTFSIRRLCQVWKYRYSLSGYWRYLTTAAAPVTNTDRANMILQICSSGWSGSNVCSRILFNLKFAVKPASVRGWLRSLQSAICATYRNTRSVATFWACEWQKAALQRPRWKAEKVWTAYSTWDSGITILIAPVPEQQVTTAVLKGPTSQIYILIHLPYF